LINLLNAYFFVLEGLNINNPVRSAGEIIPHQIVAPKGLNMIRLKFNPFEAEIAIIIYRAFHTRLLKFNPSGALCRNTNIKKDLLFNSTQN
jgi:hypothetical protein